MSSTEEGIRYAKERPDFMLQVNRRPIGMGEEPVYASRDHAVGAAVRLNLAVPISILQIQRYQSFVCETVQPDPQLESQRRAFPKSIWQMYLLGWKLTMVKLQCSQLALAAYRREGCLYVQAEKPGHRSMEKSEPYIPVGTVSEWFALWPWFHDWAKASADTLKHYKWVLRTEHGDHSGPLMFV